MNKQIKFKNAEGQEVTAEYSEELAKELLLVGIDVEQEIVDALETEDANMRKQDE